MTTRNTTFLLYESKVTSGLTILQIKAHTVSEAELSYTQTMAQRQEKQIQFIQRLQTFTMAVWRKDYEDHQHIKKNAFMADHQHNTIAVEPLVYATRGVHLELAPC